MPGRRELRETERTIATLGAGVSVCDGAGSVAPQARLAGTLFAPYSFVTGQEGLECWAPRCLRMARTPKVGTGVAHDRTTEVAGT